MECPDCGGTSVVEWVSILLAAGAFFVSGASLWLASLRRPNVNVDRIPTRGELQATGWTGAMVSGTRMTLHFYVANSGASGTVVERLTVTEFREVSDRQRIWSDLEPGTAASVVFPLAMERDDAKTGDMRGGLAWNNEPPQIATEDDFARRLGGPRAVSVTFVWAFRRPHLFRPWRQKTVERREVVAIDAAEYREQNLSHWRTAGGGAYTRLVDIAEARTIDS
jgi:hypothetical protein